MAYICRTKKSKLVKYGQTINLCLGCLAMGLMTSVVGTTLVDLSEIYGTQTERSSHIITFRGCGALIGSLFGGMLLDRFNTQALITFAMLMASIAASLIPVCPILSIAYGASFIYGIMVGAIDTGANVWIINLWGEKNGPMLQIYRFAFGFGGLLAPIMAEPFLSHHQEGTGAASTPDPFSRGIDDKTRLVSAVLKSSCIHIPYDIIASFHFMIFVSMLVFYLIDSSDTKPPQAARNKGLTAGRCKRYALLMSFSLYVLIYVALQSCLGQMLSTFAVKSKLKFSKSQASFLSSLFWTTLTMFRAFSVFWASKSSPRCMMLTQHTMSLFAFAMFLWFGETHKTMVWVCAATVGIGTGGMHATATTWTAQFMPLTNAMMSIAAIFSGLGEMAPPFIVGGFIDENTMVLVYACAGLGILLTIIMIIMWAITRTMIPRRSLMHGSEFDYVGDAENAARAVVIPIA